MRAMSDDLKTLAHVLTKSRVTMFSGLSNDTQLKWDAGKEPDLACYEIVWRDTTEAVCAHARAVGNVNAFTMKGMSKDNYFFAVRAVDREGNKSPASFPRPVRPQ